MFETLIVGFDGITADGMGLVLAIGVAKAFGSQLVVVYDEELAVSSPQAARDGRLPGFIGDPAERSGLAGQRGAPAETRVRLEVPRHFPARWGHLPIQSGPIGCEALFTVTGTPVSSSQAP